MRRNGFDHLPGLLDSGKSNIVIEHHQAVMTHADWLINLGPGAGHNGGRIVLEGSPAQHLTAYMDALPEPADAVALLIGLVRADGVH